MQTPNWLAGLIASHAHNQPLQSYDSDLEMAETAELLLSRLRREDSPRARRQLVAWMRQSPKHVREILLAYEWDRMLDAHFEHGRIENGGTRHARLSDSQSR